MSMAKYRVLNDCFGYQGRYWVKGEIALLDPSTKPPKHFQRIDAPVAVAPVVEPTKVEAVPEPEVDAPKVPFKKAKKG